MKSIIPKEVPALLVAVFTGPFAFAQKTSNYISIDSGNHVVSIIALILFFLFFATILLGYSGFRHIVQKRNSDIPRGDKALVSELNSKQIDLVLKAKNTNCCSTCKTGSKPVLPVILILSLLGHAATAQNLTGTGNSLFSQPGILITLMLVALPLLLAIILLIHKSTRALKKLVNEEQVKHVRGLAEELINNTDRELEELLEQRKQALNYSLQNNELSGNENAADKKGIIQHVNHKHEINFTASKKRAAPRPALDPDITKLILWYLGCAAFWLLVGTGIGEYVGIKFVVPDADHISWLSFGRLRPVHTNIVFWGWASLGILGLGYYVVPTVSNTKLYRIKWGWIALILINLQVITGSISLMAGINNGGGEFREYIWPIMTLFAAALILTLVNFYKTVAKRSTKEIYISNWYILSAIIFTIIIASTAYLPFWQDGLGETIIQGYYMHSGVGMWFTLFTLGLLYYFIPQQINKPIYAYSLGILAFWTQILFYTIIGTHHFVFSAIPWWLQTVAIVGSMGMIIPVVAATINYFMTFKGNWHKVTNSYTLPFFLTAVVYYFVVSMQGTAEAFRFTNLLWHFTDFTVAHSHLGFYGIITFAIWGGTYAIVPRLTSREPKQHLVGAHFWLAFIGLLLYCVPLMIGGTIKGMMWMDKKPFIDSVVMMFDYWVWRAIGGSLMFVSHIIFFYNFYRMTASQAEEIDIKETAFKELEKELATI